MMGVLEVTERTQKPLLPNVFSVAGALLGTCVQGLTCQDNEDNEVDVNSFSKINEEGAGNRDGS